MKRWFRRRNEIWENFFWEGEENPLSSKKIQKDFFKKIEKIGISSETIERIVKELREMEEKIKGERDFPTVKIIFSQRNLAEKNPETVEKLKEQIDRGETLLSPENYSGGEMEKGEPKIYLVIDEFLSKKGLRKESIISAFSWIFSSLFLSENFGEEFKEIEESLASKLRAKMGGEREKEIQEDLQQLVEDFKLTIPFLAGFIFSGNFLGKERLAEIVRKQIELKRKQTEYVFRLLSNFQKKDEEELECFLTEIFYGWVVASIIDWVLFFEEARTIGRGKLERKIQREINKIKTKKGLRRVSDLFQIFKISDLFQIFKSEFEKIREKLEERYLQKIDLREYFPPEMLPERLVEILENKKLPELAQKVKKKGITEETLKEIEEKIFITKEDLEKVKIL